MQPFKTTASKQDMTEVQQHLDRIEHLLLEEQKRKIQSLEARMKKLEDALPVGRQASPSSTR
jgi:cell division septum initiation protein DivIVA